MDKNDFNSLIEIKKSKFFGYVFNIASVDEVGNILSQLKLAHKKATHICYAYSIISPFQEKFFDDGEPLGTAGRPILNVIQKQKLCNVIICVVRYFGGIKLGGGGLVRAYTKSASEAIKNAY